MRFHSAIATRESQKYAIARSLDGKQPADQRASCLNLMEIELFLALRLFSENFQFFKRPLWCSLYFTLLEKFFESIWLFWLFATFLGKSIFQKGFFSAS